MTDTPNPGSPEAVRQGCTCPVIYNRYGKGIRDDRDEFWINGGCLLHGMEAEDGHD